ncbi:MAG: hypothetical protein [Microviridae sp.]|nr:MAG: hypothetical protein [Microviridae sp.]
MKTFTYRYYLHDGSNVAVRVVDDVLEYHEGFCTSLRSLVDKGELRSVTREYLYETDLEKICNIEPVSESPSFSRSDDSSGKPDSVQSADSYLYPEMVKEGDENLEVVHETV